jgi:signal transduction histidine kinase
MGLVEALRSRLETVEKRSGIQTEFVPDGYVDLPKTVEAELYRVAIEALNNALKHAGADRVTASLVKKGRTLRLQVRDNCKGFNINEIQPGGLGLKNMADRVEHIGGKLSIQSELDQGTEVSITIPC